VLVSSRMKRRYRERTMHPALLHRPQARRFIPVSLRRLISLLDHSWGRPLISRLIERVIRNVHGEATTVRYARDGYWVVDWPQASVPMPELWHSPSPLQYEDRARDVFFQEYIPSAGDVVMDIGAGIGWELNLFSRLVGENGHVYAIEADPDNFRCLRGRQELNHLVNVTPIQAAVTDKAGEAIISSEGFHESHHLIDEGPGHTVRTLTVDDLVIERGIERIDFLKMNIEGAERLALAGMEQSASLVENIVVGCHDFLADRGLGDDSVRTSAFVREYLVRHGFEVIERRSDDDRDWAQSFLYGRRRRQQGNARRRGHRAGT
jgi:FkbM family methyltransferase